MQEIVMKLMGFMDRFRGMDVDSMIHLILLAALAAFGIVNVLLGYRILRFWMMLGGFAIGAGLGYLLCDLMEITDRNVWMGVSLGAGAALGLIAFFVYRAGIFLIGAGVGLTLSVYVLHPTTSAVFFACILAGIGLGVLGVKYSRPVIILATSVMGGAVAGIASAKLTRLPELPFAVLIGLALAVIGAVIQFAANKPEVIEEDEEEETDVKGSQNKRYADARPAEDIVRDVDIRL